jgi:hypothetical protein
MANLFSPLYVGLVFKIYFYFYAILQSTPPGAISKSSDWSDMRGEVIQWRLSDIPKGAADSTIVSQPSGRGADQSANGVAIFEPSGVVKPGQWWDY